MATRTFWQRWRYRINGLLLLAPCWFLYDALTPTFPPEWPEQPIGPFSAAPRPADDNPPYPHDGGYLKDFSVRFCDGCVTKIRTAHVSVGRQPLEQPATDGLLHGSSRSQHVHVPYPPSQGAGEMLWVSVQEWSGRMHHAAWPLPQNQ